MMKIVNQENEYNDTETGAPQDAPKAHPKMHLKTQITSKKVSNKNKKRNEAFSLPSFEIIDQAAIRKIRKLLNEVADYLYETEIFRKAHSFKNTMIKAGKNERAVLHALVKCADKKTFSDGGPWPYCKMIVEVESGNYGERDYQRSEEQFG